jgi:hypothetical protein
MGRKRVVHDLHEPDGTINRFCTKCKTVKNLVLEFAHKRKLEDGNWEYHSQCRECRQHYNRARNLRKGHKPTLCMRKDISSKLFVINEKIRKLEQQRDEILASTNIKCKP